VSSTPHGIHHVVGTRADGSRVALATCSSAGRARRVAERLEKGGAEYERISVEPHARPEPRFRPPEAPAPAPEVPPAPPPAPAPGSPGDPAAALRVVLGLSVALGRPPTVPEAVDELCLVAKSGGGGWGRLQALQEAGYVEVVTLRSSRLVRLLGLAACVERGTEAGERLREALEGGEEP
jgi:hypothetical protein